MFIRHGRPSTISVRHVTSFQGYCKNSRVTFAAASTPFPPKYFANQIAKMNTPRVLSIQSHVVSGYVGNKSATFPLQVLGFEVDAVNTVQFSNHTGYKIIKGKKIGEQELTELYEGLVLNGVNNYTHLLTGYMISTSTIIETSKIIQDLRKKNPNILYVCDPVLGDNGKMYVPEEIRDGYKNYLIPLADIITPNQYEVEWLTGLPVKTVDDAWRAISVLHGYGCKTVVISSSELGNCKDQMLCIGSSVLGGTKSAVTIQFPIFPLSFTGTGDLFAALLLAWMSRSNNNLKDAIEHTIATMQAILKRTADSVQDANDPAQREIKLIQSMKDIEKPSITIKANLEN